MHQAARLCMSYADNETVRRDGGQDTLCNIKEMKQEADREEHKRETISGRCSIQRINIKNDCNLSKIRSIICNKKIASSEFFKCITDHPIHSKPCQLPFSFSSGSAVGSLPDQYIAQV